MSDTKSDAEKFTENLFGNYDRLVCSKGDEDKGRAGWSKQPVIDSLQVVLTTAQSSLATAVLEEIENEPLASQDEVINAVRDLFTRKGIKIEEVGNE